jgi:hypothetical protein
MRALSVKQPWADAIVRGRQRVEFRSWRTAYRGPLAIHASTRPAAGAGELPLGCLVGVVTLVDCKPARGGWRWLLADPRPLARPVACKGRLGLFDVELPA